MSMKIMSAVLGLILVAGIANAQGIFWTEVGGGKIDSSRFNGTNENSPLTGLSSPYGIAYDGSSGKIYWTDVTDGIIYSSSKDGTQTVVLENGLSLPRGIAVDEANGYMYWVENGSKKIRSAPLAGGSPVDILTSGLSAPTGIAVDARNGNIYWTDNGGSMKYIGMCGLTGTGAAHIDSSTSFVSGIAVDTVDSRIYWTEYGPQKRIRSAALNGSDTATVVTLDSADPRGIQLMSSAGMIFWTNYLTNTVESANVDGSDAAIVVSSGLNNPLSIMTTTSEVLASAFAGYPGSALYFDGSSNYVNAGTSSAFNFSGPFTVEGWFKVSSFPYQWDALITKGDDSWRIARSNFTNNLAFSTNGLSNVDMTGVTNVNDGRWHFFAAVYDGSSKTLYVDGKVDATSAVTGTLSSSTYPVYFGDNAGFTGRYFNGDMDEIRIWNIARTENQVRNDMFTTIGAVQPGLLGYWQFNEGSGSVVADTVSGNNGTISGTDNWVTSTAPVGQYGSYDADAAADSVGPAGANISVTILSHPDSLDFIGAYAYGSPSTSITSEAFPAGITSRSSLVWGLYGYGQDTAVYSLSYSGIAGITNESTLHLLSRSAADIPWTDATGSFTHSSLLHNFTSTTTALDSAAPSVQLAVAGGSDNSLAVQLSSLRATTDVNSVTLTWQTASEAGISGFNVLRKEPGRADFSVIGSYTNDDSLRGTGTSTQGRAYDFTDYKITSGSTYTYEIQSVSTSGNTENLSTILVTVNAPRSYALYQNYPNPFNPSTTIRFDLKEASNVTLAIYNVLGQKVLERSYGTMNSGRYNEDINLGQYASGVYYYTILATGIDGQSFRSTKKLMMLK
jgi:Concanavalin A-like lectin/glucanases superfamily/Secretion system C-terminal sorting domain/Low-density lipoprotein receptor repeat class B